MEKVTYRYSQHATVLMIIVLTLTSTFYPLSAYADRVEETENSDTVINPCNVTQGRMDEVMKQCFQQLQSNNDLFGIWMYVQYQDMETYAPVKITFIQFIYMLFHPSYGLPYYLDVDKDGENDVYGEIRFYLTSFSEPTFSPGIKMLFTTQLEESIERDGELTVALEVRVPAVLSGGYVAAKTGYYSPRYEVIPEEVSTGFSFSFDLFMGSSQMFQLDITPEGEGLGNLTMFFSYSRFSSDGIEATNRTFFVDFKPAVELHIRTIPKELRVHYDFGRSAGVKTKISFRSSDGSFLDKIHSFVIDPLPEYMSFDLTVFGEGSFLYESDRSYSVTYSMESIQNQFLVELQLVDLPERIEANWGLDINLGLKSASGFVDLDMSDNLGEVALYFNNSEKPFMRVTDFPKKLCLNGFIDSNLRGCISASKYSGSPTVLSVTFAFGRWEITGALTLKDGYLSVLWNLPSSGSTHAMVGLDTNDNAMIGANIVVEDTEENIDLLYVGFDAVATDDLLFSWDVDVFGNISNFRLNGRITKLLDLHVSVYYRGGYFDVTGSWVLGESGSFLIQFNKEVDFTFANITSDQFKLYGYLSLYADRKIKIEWEWGETGYFTVYTFGKSVGKKLQLEFGYGPKQEDIYRYGFNFAATEFLNATRTVQWDTENGVIPRIWILGDQPLPEGWAAKLLWNYEWYEVI